MAGMRAVRTSQGRGANRGLQVTSAKMHTCLPPLPPHQCQLSIQPLERLPAALLAPAQHQHCRQGSAGGQQAHARHHQPYLQAVEAASSGAWRGVGHPAGQVRRAVGAQLWGGEGPWSRVNADEGKWSRSTQISRWEP